MEDLKVVVISLLVSVIYNKIEAAKTFETIDSYVREVIELAKQSMKG